MIKPPLYQKAGFLSPKVSVFSSTGVAERPSSSCLSPFKSAMAWLPLVMMIKIEKLD